MLCCKKKNEKAEIVPHPDGGWGWFVCLATFTTQFIVLGTMNNFGLIYVELLKAFPGSSTSSAAWVGSITYGMMFVLGPLATTLCAKLSCRVTTMIGCTIAGTGCLLGSFSTAMWQMNLTYGFLFGFGASMCYFPSVVILGQYFWKKLSLANGITSSGSGVGTLAMGPILQKLLKYFGLRNTMRISAGMIICVWLCALIYRPINTVFLNNKSEDDENQEKKPKGPRFPALQIFKNRAYILWCVALSFWMLGYFVPFVHLVRLALDFGIDIDRATLLIGLMSIGSTAGRLIFGKIADHPKVNRLYLYQFSFLVMGICNTVCPILTNYIGLAAYSFIWGFFEGCYVLLAPVLTGDIVGRDKMAAGVGILFAIKSVPLTVGPPLAGFIYDASGSYQVAFYIAGAVPTLAACLMFGIPFLMPEGINNSRVPEKEIFEVDNEETARFDYRKHWKKNKQEEDDQDVVRFDWREYDNQNQVQQQQQMLAPIPEITVDTDTSSDDMAVAGGSVNKVDNLRPKSMGQSTTSLNVDHPWQVRATSNGHLSTITPIRETCLVTVDSTSRTHLSELRNTLSASVFSLVKKYMDMPRLVSASECGGSMGCIPAHIAADPANKPPSNSSDDTLLVVGKETVV